MLAVYNFQKRGCYKIPLMLGNIYRVIQLTLFRPYYFSVLTFFVYKIRFARKLPYYNILQWLFYFYKTTDMDMHTYVFQTSTVSMETNKDMKLSSKVIKLNYRFH